MKRVPLRRVVLHADVAVVIGDDPRDDRETEAGPLGLRREVRLEDPPPVLGRDAHPVVGDLEADALERRIPGAAHHHPPAALAATAALDRRDRVVDQVGERPADLLAVDLDGRQAGIELRVEGDVLGAVVARDGVGDDAVQVAGLGVRRRKPREVRELVDQQLEAVDLAGDGVDAFVEDLDVVGIRGGARPEAAPDALRRELDRRERVLDLVGDPARHLAPGDHALHLDRLRVVVEHDHRAEHAARLVVQERHRHQQDREILAERNLGLAPDALAHGRAELADQIDDQVAQLHLARAVGEAAADRAGARRDAELAARGGVQRGDATLGVEREHPGADRAEHHLHRAAPLVELGVRTLEARPRIAQVARHAVEGAHQEADLVVGRRLDGDLQVSARHLRGGRGERADRPGDALRDAEADPGGEHQDHEEAEQQLEQVGGPDVPGARLERAVLRERLADHADVAGERLGHEVVEDQRSGRAPGAPARGDRHGAADHVAVADVPPPASRRVPASAERTSSLAPSAKTSGRQLGIDRARERLALRVEDLDHAEVEAALLGADQGVERGAAAARAAGRGP